MHVGSRKLNLIENCNLLLFHRSMENISDAYLFGVRLKSCVYPFFLFPLPRKWMNGESREKEFSVNDHGNTRDYRLKQASSIGGMRLSQTHFIISRSAARKTMQLSDSSDNSLTRNPRNPAAIAFTRRVPVSLSDLQPMKFQPE